MINSAFINIFLNILFGNRWNLKPRDLPNRSMCPFRDENKPVCKASGSPMSISSSPDTLKWCRHHFLNCSRYIHSQLGQREKEFINQTIIRICEQELIPNFVSRGQDVFLEEDLKKLLSLKCKPVSSKGKVSEFAVRILTEFVRENLPQIGGVKNAGKEFESPNHNFVSGETNQVRDVGSVSEL